VLCGLQPRAGEVRVRHSDVARYAQDGGAHLMRTYRICRQIGTRLADVSLSFTDALTIVAPSRDVALERARKLVADSRNLVAIATEN
jgi:hypothetical protein